MVGIYKITSPSGKIYIGQSWDIIDRWRHYKRPGYKNNQIKLQRSFKKYGVENHIFEIIHYLPMTTKQQILDQYEIFYIEQYKESGVELLNLRDGGHGAKHTEQSKEKIREAHLGKPKHTKESRKKIGKASKNRPRDKNWRTLQSLAHKGKTRKFSDNHINNIKKARCRPILRFNKNNVLIDEWPSITEAIKHLNKEINLSGKITMAAQGKRKTAFGYIWKYKNN
jgi:group I intron endonuclease